MIQQFQFWIYTQNIENSDSTRLLHANVHDSVILNSQKGENNPNVPTNEWIDKMWSKHTSKYYSPVKRKEMLTWMNLEKVH